MGARALYHDPLPMGLIAVALMLGTSALFQVSVSIPLLIAGFCGTALVYGVDRGVISSPEDRRNRPDRRRWVTTHQTWIRGEVVIFAVGGVSAMGFLSSRTLLCIAGLGGVAALHLFSVGTHQRPLKASGIAKPLAIGGAWAVGGTVLPLLEGGHTVGFEAVMGTVYRFLFILPNVLVADWVDRGGDAAVGLDTWAPEGTLFSLRVMSTGLLAIAGVGAVLAVVRFGAPTLLLVDVLGLFGMAAAVWGLRPGRSPEDAFLFDLVVAWPVVVWGASRLMGL